MDWNDTSPDGIYVKDNCRPLRVIVQTLRFLLLHLSILESILSKFPLLENLMLIFVDFIKEICLSYFLGPCIVK